MTPGFNLGDSLSDSQRNSIIVHVGSVFLARLTEDDGITPKDGEPDRKKYIVIVGFDRNGGAVGVVLVGSHINFNISQNRHGDGSKFYYPLSSSSYPDIFNHNSFVNCNRIVPLSQSRIVEECQYIGCIEQDDLIYILRTCLESTVLEPKTKTLYHITDELSKLESDDN